MEESKIYREDHPRPRRILVAGNWKMNHGVQATQEFALNLVSGIKTLSPTSRDALTSSRVEALLFPPYLSLVAAHHSLQHSHVHVGAQNVHSEEKGAFTGEISGPMLKEIGINWTLVAHSERRQYFGETDSSAKKRISSHLKQGFKSVFCYGETRAEREAGETEKVLERQLRDGLPDEWSENLILAYEPVWAIGTGLTATPEQAQEAHRFSRAFLERRWGKFIASKTLILYGGSVTPENFEGLLSQEDVDGGLVGGASLKSESFLKLIEIAGKML